MQVLDQTEVVGGFGARLRDGACLGGKRESVFAVITEIADGGTLGSGGSHSGQVKLVEQFVQGVGGIAGIETSQLLRLLLGGDGPTRKQIAQVISLGVLRGNVLSLSGVSGIVGRRHLCPLVETEQQEVAFVGVGACEMCQYMSFP